MTYILQFSTVGLHFVAFLCVLDLKTAPTFKQIMYKLYTLYKSFSSVLMP